MEKGEKTWNVLNILLLLVIVVLLLMQVNERYVCKRAVTEGIQKLIAEKHMICNYNVKHYPEILINASGLDELYDSATRGKANGDD